MRVLIASLCCTLALLALGAPIGAHGPAGESHIERFTEFSCREQDGLLVRQVTYELNLDLPDGPIRYGDDGGKDYMWEGLRQVYHYNGPKPVCIKINSVFPTMDVLPLSVNGRTLVPLRVVAESFGPAVAIWWDEPTRTVHLTQSAGDTVTTWLLRPEDPRVEMLVNGQPSTVLELDVPPVIQHGRTMVPLRFIAESLGATVEWDGERRLVTITGGLMAAP